MAPIVRTGADGERELVRARWGMLGPLPYGGQAVTNIHSMSNPIGGAGAARARVVSSQ
jgi:hypothetical protein